MNQFKITIIAVTTLVLFHLLSGKPDWDWFQTNRLAQNNNRFWQEQLEADQPSILMLGNSILLRGIDADRMQMGLKTPVASWAELGMYTGWYYLVVKNRILPARHHPDILVIPFRDYHLTHPDMMGAKGFEYVVYSALTEDEPVFHQYVDVDPRHPLTRLFGRISSLYQDRNEVKGTIDWLIKGLLLGGLFELDWSEIDQANERAFEYEFLAHRELNRRLVQQVYWEWQELPPFETLLEESLLPHIIEMCRSQDIQLVLLRMKRHVDFYPRFQARQTERYMEKFREYLRQNNVALFDFTDDPRIRLDHLRISDHFNPYGAQAFTEILLKTILPGLRPVESQSPDGSPTTRLRITEPKYDIERYVHGLRGRLNVVLDESMLQSEDDAPGIESFHCQLFLEVPGTYHGRLDVGEGCQVESLMIDDAPVDFLPTSDPPAGFYDFTLQVPLSRFSYQTLRLQLRNRSGPWPRLIATRDDSQFVAVSESLEAETPDLLTFDHSTWLGGAIRFRSVPDGNLRLKVETLDPDEPNRPSPLADPAIYILVEGESYTQPGDQLWAGPNRIHPDRATPPLPRRYALTLSTIKTILGVGMAAEPVPAPVPQLPGNRAVWAWLEIDRDEQGQLEVDLTPSQPYANEEIRTVE